MSGEDPNITAPAQALVQMLDGLAGFTAYLWERPEFDKIPAVAVGVPGFRRHGPDQPESQLHTLDWWLEYPISFYVDLAKAVKDQQRMVDGLQAVASVIDADPSLGNTVFDAAITEATPFVDDERRRPLAGYQVTVTALKLVQPA